MNAVSVAGGVTSAARTGKGKTEKGGMGSVGNLFGKVTDPVGDRHFCRRDRFQ